MSPFQYIILATLGLIAVTLVVGAARGQVGRLTATVWLVVLVVGGVLAVDPELATAVARTVGIRRGADLLLYVLVLAVLQGFLLVYLRLRRLRREMTELVRHIALRDAESRTDGRGGG